MAICIILFSLKSFDSKLALYSSKIFNISNDFLSDEWPPTPKNAGVKSENSLEKWNLVEFFAFFSVVLIFISNTAL